jgi:hypothetical protein
MKLVATISTIFLTVGLASQFFSDKAFFTHELSVGEILIGLSGIAMAWVLALSYMPISRIFSGDPPGSS